MKTALVLYFPVIHNGILGFIENHPAYPIFIIGEELILEVEKNNEEESRSVVRDKRKLSEDHILCFLQTATFGSRDVKILDAQNIEELSCFDSVILPEDSFHRAFVECFKKNIPEAFFENSFFRWDKIRTLNKDEKITDLTISAQELRGLGFFKFVEESKEISQRSPDWWRQVGAVLVKDGQQVSSAFNQHLPSEFETYFSGDPRANFNAGEYIELSVAAHAEASLISLAAKKGISTKGGELFVTTFPCPPCAIHIALSGISRVYFIEGYSMVNSVDIFKEFGVEVFRVV